MFFSSGMGSGPSRVAPWTPWIDIKIPPPFLFFIILHCFVINDDSNNINRCWDPSRTVYFDWGFNLS